MKRQKIDTEEFIRRAKLIHNYDYSLTEYNHSKEKVKIICSIHGIFEQIPNNHLSGAGCRFCKNKSRGKNSRYNKDIFLKKSKEIHGDKYDYSNVEYVNSSTKVKIICKIHGEFSQSPSSHFNNCGCPNCSNNVRLTNDEFIIKSKLTHGDRYDYSLVDYKNNSTKIKIICPKHNIFKQQPAHHINGSGCPVCNVSLGVISIINFLSDFKIKFDVEKRFKDCRNILPLPFDFYLPEYNICIEYDGQQHYKPMGYKSGFKKFKKTIKRDEIKNNYCKENNIKLLRISYKDNVKEALIKNILPKLK
jgi:very-short-patch-repair endonuclease